MNSLQGRFLVASPKLPDENFFRSVVLMVQHDEDGAFGVVLNRPTNNTVEEIWEMISKQPCHSRRSIHVGGPVNGPLLALHTDEILSEREIIPGVYLSTNKDLLDQLVAQDDQSVRIFTGYAGWAGGQLEGEMEVGGWLTAPASADEVFYEKDDLWDKVSRNIGRDILAATVKPKHISSNPNLN